MTLYFIGLGLADEKDISVKGLEVVRSCDKLYLESYTSVLGVDKSKLVSYLNINLKGRILWKAGDYCRS